ncbi:MAG TPA: hypothetical protein VLJ20_13590 [Acetobacteraceae bacterium]|nr:hypothetical protein [Acetobacteraceae bacterium]
MTVEPTILAEASAAVGFLAPYLVEAGKGAAKKVGENSVTGAGKLLGWMRGKLSGRGKEALDNLENNPESDDNQADLRKQLVKLLETEPGLRDELRSLLPAGVQVDRSIRQSVQGTEATGIAITGDSNTVNR